MSKRLLAVLVLHLFCVQSQAATVQVALPGLIGDYRYQFATLRVAAFDLGVRFADIDSVTLTVSASGTAGRYRACNVLLPGGCGPLLDLPAEGVVWVPFAEVGGAFPLDAIGPFDPQISTLTHPVLPAPSGSLDFLLDGAAQINVTPNTLTCIDCRFEFAIYPVFTVHSAQLTVRGTLVPLPGSLFLFGGALLTLASRYTISS